MSTRNVSRLSRAAKADAAAALKHAVAIDPQAARSLTALCTALTGERPRWTKMEQEGCFLLDHKAPTSGRGNVFLRDGLPLPKARGVLGHELGHSWYRATNNEGADLEARCDAFGLAIVRMLGFRGRQVTL